MCGGIFLCIACKIPQPGSHHLSIKRVPEPVVVGLASSKRKRERKSKEKIEMKETYELICVIVYMHIFRV